MRNNQKKFIRATTLLALIAVCVWTFTGWQASDVPQKPAEIAAAENAFAREDWPRAIEHFRKAIAQGHDNPHIHMRLGYAVHMLGKYEEAMPHHLRAASAMHPEIRIDGLYNAACAQARLGNKDAALEFLAKTIDAGFRDATQLERDADMDSLRSDERFKKLAAGVGKDPVLHQWMDFFIGEWEQFGPAPKNELLDSLTITRSTESSRALSTLSQNIGGGEWAGMLWPDPQTRTWRWTTIEKTGAIQELIGSRDESGAMVFAGRERTAVGPGAHVRLTYEPRADGSVLEKAESSLDGQSWRVHHEAAYVRKAD